MPWILLHEAWAGSVCKDKHLSRIVSCLGVMGGITPRRRVVFFFREKQRHKRVQPRAPAAPEHRMCVPR